MDHYFYECSLHAVHTHTLDLARASDQKGLQALLESISHRTDYLKAETTICETLLENDFIEMYRFSFQDGFLSKWCRNNTAHAVRHCPSIVEYWVTHADDRVASAYACIARELQTMPEAARAHLLRGRPDLDLGGYPDAQPHKLLSQYLAQASNHWRHLSPVWIGAPGSTLRKAAIAGGWSPAWLGSMVHKNIWEPSANEWIGHIDYPYTLMACEEFRVAREWGNHVPKLPEILTCASATTALDIALAKEVLAQCANGPRMFLRRPRSIKPVDEATQERVQGFVQAHVLMDTLEDFAMGLARRLQPVLKCEEALQLPDLGIAP